MVLSDRSSADRGELPPSVAAYETVVLIACSSGISFTLPNFESIAERPFCVRQVYFYWIVRDQAQLDHFEEAVISAIARAEDSGLAVTVEIHVTGSEALTPLAGNSDHKCNCSSLPAPIDAASLRKDSPTVKIESSSSSSTEVSTDVDIILEAQPPAVLPTACCCTRPTLCIARGCLALNSTPSSGPAVEGAHGETAILACGGGSFARELSGYVAALSDERAVHKGSGAQGLFLFTETYGLH